MNLRRCGMLLISACFLAGSAAAQIERNLTMPGPLPLFPGDNWWNVDVSAAPVDTNSGPYLSFIGLTKGLHPDFGGNDPDNAPNGIYGMIYITVPGSQPLEPVAFDYASQSDVGAPGRPAGYPIPVQAKTEARWMEGGQPGNAAVGGDKHLLIIDRDNRLLFETWNTRCLPAGNPNCTWRAGSGAAYVLDSNRRRPDTWTSADAAGLAILPGLVRYDEVYLSSEPIRHAFRFTTDTTNQAYVYPASHQAGVANPSAPPMGMRLRLKASKDISGFSAPLQRIFQAMKTYGLILADNGTDMYIQGTYDTRWDNGILNPAFSSLKVSDFEVVQLGWKPPVSVSRALPACASTVGGKTIEISGNDFRAGVTVTLGGTPANVTSFSPTSLLVTAGARASAPHQSVPIAVTNPAAGGSASSASTAFTYARRGDANDNGSLTGADAFFLKLAIFLGGPQPASLCNGDANGNGAITGADSFFLNLHIFLGGPAPPP